jgi:hypothetical protein
MLLREDQEWGLILKQSDYEDNSEFSVLENDLVCKVHVVISQETLVSIGVKLLIIQI